VHEERERRPEGKHVARPGEERVVGGKKDGKGVTSGIPDLEKKQLYRSTIKKEEEKVDSGRVSTRNPMPQKHLQDNRGGIDSTKKNHSSRK